MYGFIASQGSWVGGTHPGKEARMVQANFALKEDVTARRTISLMKWLKRHHNRFTVGRKSRSEMSGHSKESHQPYKKEQLRGIITFLQACSEHKPFLRVFPASPDRRPCTLSTDCSDLVNTPAVPQSPNGWNEFTQTAQYPKLGRWGEKKSHVVRARSWQ